MVEDGVLLLRAENKKVNKILGEKDDRNKRIKRIPVISELKNVLEEECEYNCKIGID